jgi:aminoglycoside phosphotransferase (APT) family kinase protein
VSHAIAEDDLVDELADVRPGDREPLLALGPLRRFLDRHDLGAGELHVEPLGDGHSNVTFLIEREGAEVILRRPPRGPLPPSAHDVVREARLLERLAGTAVRTPRVLAVGDDPAILGAPFYLMERVNGTVITHMMPPGLASAGEERRVSEEMVEALAEIHALDLEAAGLSGFGRPSGYLERQLRRFAGLWELSKTREVPGVERIHEWLLRCRPASGPSTLVHGDYRLGNVMFADGAPARLVAVFDWEMAAVGDPLADVGYLLTAWTDRDDRAMGPLELQPVTRTPGFLSRSEILEYYERVSGRVVPDPLWYQVLGFWKTAIFMEGNYRRAITGATDDPFLAAFGDGVLALVDHTEGQISGG